MLSLTTGPRQVIKSCIRQCGPSKLRRRVLSSIPTTSDLSEKVPWFMDPADRSPRLMARIERNRPPHISKGEFKPTLPPLPADIPASLAHLHTALRASPHLEPGTLLVREPIQTDAGPPLPPALPKGRRKRGGTYFGEGLGEALEGGGIWNWVMIAQVKDGTENRGAIESVIRVVRKTLLTAAPPLPLPPNSKRKVNDGWAMLDAGEFAVHIVSREARRNFFPEKRHFDTL